MTALFYYGIITINLNFLVGVVHSYGKSIKGHQGRASNFAVEIHFPVDVSSLILIFMSELS